MINSLRKGARLRSMRSASFVNANLSSHCFYETDSGQPLVPREQWLPASFPRIGPLPPTNIEDEVASALRRRPEPRRIEIELRQLHLDLRLANNQMLPRLDFVLEGSQDVGLPGTSSDDKGLFELVVGATGAVPIQRRNARGKRQEATAKIAQVSEKLRLQRDKIGVEVRTAFASLALSATVVQQAQIAFKTFSRYTRTLSIRVRSWKDRFDLPLICWKPKPTSQQSSSSMRNDYGSRNWLTSKRQQALTHLNKPTSSTQLPPSDLPAKDNKDAPIPDAEAFDKDWQLRIGTPEQP